MDPRAPALFLDRDGVLIEDKGYLFRPEDVVWLPGVDEALAAWRAAGFRIIVITNQSGVARGYFDEVAVLRLHAWMNARLGSAIDAFYYCPHGPDSDCACRKPRPGMFLQAIAEHQIDPARSLAVGDSARDIEAAAAAGVRGVVFPGGNLAEFLRAYLP